MSTESERTAARPLNGEEYLASLDDGRQIYIYGDLVKDVTQHPGFRNTARMIARLYDAMHAPDAAERGLAVPTDTGSGGITHPFFKSARTPEDLLASARAIEAWARTTYGWLARSPDYKASFLGTLGSNTDFYEPFGDNARTWYKRAQEELTYFNHAIVNPPVDRNRPLDEVKDVYMHVEKETDAGLLVSGAKVVATGSAFTHYNFIGHAGPVPASSREFSAIFIAPMNSPGVKLICRPSYEFTAATVGSPFDYPLSSRMDENDSILIFDNVLVPWENVFCYGDIDKTNGFFAGSGFVFRAMLHGCVRLGVKMDFLCGLLLKALDLTGTSAFRGVQSRIGEVLALRNLFWACTDSMTRNPVPFSDGTVLPNPDAASAYRLAMTTAYPRIKNIFESDLGSALVYMNSNSKDWDNPDIAGYLDKYVRGQGASAQDRLKVMKLTWDAIGTEFGGRQELYELNYSGNHEDLRIQTLFGAMHTGQTERYKAFVDQCLSEYDVHGWTAPDLINPTDVNVHHR